MHQSSASDPEVMAVSDRPVGRRRALRPLLHAVPRNDRTRSALCGARVGGAPQPWGRGGQACCPECCALIAAPAPVLVRRTA